MTLTILGLEFSASRESQHVSLWKCGDITITRDGDPTCCRAECHGLKSMFHRDPETALGELFRLADEMVQAAELVREVRGGKKEVQE